MTSLLPKKRPTTPQSMRVVIKASQQFAIAACLVVSAAWCGTLQAAPWQELFGAASGDVLEAEAASSSGQPQEALKPLDISLRLHQPSETSRSGSVLGKAPQIMPADIDAETNPIHYASRTEESAEAVAAGRFVLQPDPEVCAADAEACRQALEQLRLDRISEIDLDIRVDGLAGNDYPCECRLEGEVFVPRNFATTTFTWKAAGYCHKPLYFEHWNFERYGHSYGWAADPFISAAHFFGTLPILPYKMGVELPWECVYPVGYYRPGNCAPWTVPAFPISARGMAVEAATVTGLVFLLP
jgi:hypothetical protein